MYRTNKMNRLGSGTTRNLGILASLVLVSATACTAEAPAPSKEIDVEAAKATLLATACTVSSGNLTLALVGGEVGYVGRVAGCTVEPCVFANAIDSGGNICRVNSTTASIAVTGTGAAEKLVIDYSNGLFSPSTSSTPKTNVALFTGSTLMVIAPVGGGNMALGVNGLDANTLLTRGTAYVDVAMSGVDFMFNGGAGKDTFTADVAGWTTAPTGWQTSANIATAVGAVSPLALTISGGANDDTLAGGSGTNTLLGGPGNDTFVQSTVSHAEDMQGGDGIDTVDYGVRSTPVIVSVGKNAGIATAGITAAGTGYTVGDTLTVAGAKLSSGTVTVATITGGAGTGPVGTVTVGSAGSGYATGAGHATTGGTGTGATINVLTLAADDGAAGEGDGVHADIEIVKGGSGNDILNAYPVLTTDVVLIGNAGNDMITGGGGNDDLCGGAGDDKFFENAGNDNISGGAGLDTLDYTAATALVTACLNTADTAATKPCATTNGQVGEKDVVNGTLTKVCPRATLTADVGGTPTAGVAVPTTAQGGPMGVDVENITGHPTAVNHLYCGTLACTLFGGAGDDILAGGAAQDIIIGLGGNDTVTTNGGNDLVDLTNATGGYNQTIDCAGNAVTILVSTADTKTLNANCGAANVP